MSKLTLNLPTMYADHHVLRVRSALVSLSGVTAVVASAARKQVTVDYDEAATSPQDIIRELAASGYSPDQNLPLSVLPKSTDDRSAWFTLIHRVTQTEIRDLEMSGDFRRY
jgi:copper chaperone CopZ